MGSESLNQGLIVGTVRRADTGEGIWNASVLLTHIGGDAGLPRVIPYDMNGNADTNPRVDTDDDGFFALPFQWNPLQLGNIVAVSVNPHCRLYVFTGNRQRGGGEPIDTGFREQDLSDTQLCMVVNMRALTTGDLPVFQNAEWPASQVKAGVEQLLGKVADIVDKHPYTIFARLSPERYGLLGCREISLTPR